MKKCPSVNWTISNLRMHKCRFLTHNRPKRFIKCEISTSRPKIPTKYVSGTNSVSINLISNQKVFEVSLYALLVAIVTG